MYIVQSLIFVTVSCELLPANSFGASGPSYFSLVAEASDVTMMYKKKGKRKNNVVKSYIKREGVNK